MKINKSLDIDLNIISPQKHIRIHEGDVDSVDILIGVTVDDESVDLDSVTIKYDATINNYLAEQDANGSVVDDKISIPVTQNMTAMSGLLLIDVRMIQSDQILFTQTICATVEKAVVNGSTYIDFDKVTIIQRMNALEEKMDYIEELVENFDTSKLIVSVNRPPMGAPAEVDVDLLKAGDTWLQQGDNIVYKLVEAQYNYQPFPSSEPYHKFTWQPLNERYGVGNTEPPTSVTYQPIVYTVNEVQWSWLPVPKYSQGDHYLMLVDDEPTYYICVSGNTADTGVCTYRWREEGGGGDVSTKMDLAPLDPTYEQIAAMSSGQLYSDTTNHKGVIKDRQEFYDSTIAVRVFENKDGQDPPSKTISDTKIYNRGDYWINLSYQGSERVCTALYICKSVWMQGNFNWQYRWLCLYGTNSEYYTKTEIDNIVANKQNCIYYEQPKNDFNSYHSNGLPYTVGDLFIDDGTLYKLTSGNSNTGYVYYYKIILGNKVNVLNPPTSSSAAYACKYAAGDIYKKYSTPVSYNDYVLAKCYVCKRVIESPYRTSGYSHIYEWQEIPIDIYSKTEIDSMIPTVPTNISAFTNDSGYLTLETLPIYDGTVI